MGLHFDSVAAFMHDPADRSYLHRSLEANHLRKLRINAPQLTSLRILYENTSEIDGHEESRDDVLGREAEALLQFTSLCKLDLSDLMRWESDWYLAAVGRMEVRELILSQHHTMLEDMIAWLPPSQCLQELQVLILQGGEDNEVWEDRFGLAPFPAEEGSAALLANGKVLADVLLALPKFCSIGETSPAVRAIVNAHPGRWQAVPQMEDSGNTRFELKGGLACNVAERERFVSGL